MKKILFLTLVAIFSHSVTYAQSDRTTSLVNSEKNGWEYEVRAGVNIGGATPMPMPAEIRKIKSYSPKLNGTVEGVVTYWFDGNSSPWGLSTGLKVEEKGMITEADVKSYSTEIIQGSQRVAGYYTGNVKTQYNSTLLTMPVMVNYRLANQWKVRAGLYAAYRLDGEFTGFVSNGYLREGNPTGEKLLFEGDATASYDFSNELRRFQWGMQLGGSWRAFKHFTVNADLAYNINGIFKNTFKTISFPLYPLYLNIGFGYRF